MTCKPEYNEAGELLKIECGITKADPEKCNHDWKENADCEPEYCEKCGMSFTRYIFCFCP